MPIYTAIVKFEGLPTTCKQCRLIKFITYRTPNGNSRIVRIECAVDSHQLHDFDKTRSKKCSLKLQEDKDNVIHNA